MFGVVKSKDGDIWKDRQKIDDYGSSSESLTFAKKCCIIREPKYDLIDSACWQWFWQQCAKGAPVSGVLLQEKARHVFSTLMQTLKPLKVVQDGSKSSTCDMA